MPCLRLFGNRQQQEDWEAVPNFRHNSSNCFPKQNKKPLWGESYDSIEDLIVFFVLGPKLCLWNPNSTHRFFQLTLWSYHAASPSQLIRNHAQPCGIQWDLNTSAVQRRCDTSGMETMLYVCHGLSSPFHPNGLTRRPGDQGLHLISVSQTLFGFLNPTTGFRRSREVQVEAAASPAWKKVPNTWCAKRPN